MDYALFANVENPYHDARRAMAELLATVLHAEELGFEAAWLTEHHFNDFSISGALPVLLAHLAARTRRIRLGAAAFLLPLRDPVQLAEEIATLDVLSEGRLLLGVAKGGPFPQQFKHFHVEQDQARERMLEALTLLVHLLGGEKVSHAGRWYACADLTIEPRPLRPAMPVWLASMSPESVAFAAAGGHGLMAPSPAPVARVAEVFGAYRSARRNAGAVPWRGTAGDGEPLALARFFLCAASNAEARRLAADFIADFARNMGAVFSQVKRPFGSGPEAFKEENLLANAIVGDPAACREQIQALRESLGEHTLLLKPATYDPALARDALGLFADRVRPGLG